MGSAGSSGTSGGGGSGGGAGFSASGSVLGMPFTPRDVAANTNGSPPVGTYPFLEISLTDVAGGACDDSTGRRAGSRVLRIYVFNQKDQTAIGPGTYRDAPPNDELFTVAVWHAFGPAVDGACADELYSYDASATTVLTEVSATRVVGSFDVTLAGAGPDGGAGDAGAGHLSGTFNAPVCPTPDGGATTCF